MGRGPHWQTSERRFQMTAESVLLTSDRLITQSNSLYERSRDSKRMHDLPGIDLSSLWNHFRGAHQLVVSWPRLFAGSRRLQPQDRLGLTWILAMSTGLERCHDLTCLQAPAAIEDRTSRSSDTTYGTSDICRLSLSTFQQEAFRSQHSIGIFSGSTDQPWKDRSWCPLVNSVP